MDRRVNRRHFLKAATAASGALAYAGTLADPIARASGTGASTKITDRGFTPIADYPIQPKHFSDVALTDTFWKPKVATNASVTIPFEAQKLAATPARTHRQRARGGDLSLKTHPDPALQAQVDAARCGGGRAGRAGRDGNNGFEVAVTCTSPPASASCSIARSGSPVRCTRTSA